MTTSSRRRVIKDIQRLQSDPTPGVTAQPLNQNMMFCHAIINGPADTVWEAGTFHLIIRFSEEYPTKPPFVRFLSRLFHPNIYIDGHICLDILQNQWSPLCDIAGVLASIQSLLNDPNVKSPANTDAAALLEKHPNLYYKEVLKCVEESWQTPKVTMDFLQSYAL